ncbi:unnamed protein product [Triticum turgidum subsp. durum]|uniref:Uncharacterized protein n=1 Tax=Triticum turgidum subsp. durum TaxID=4567 RepID=A0A9R1B8N6_TRITD|nr:unnamed protein product [Triticum turgidum subsp. durum]
MAGSIRVTMEVGADGVALITICNPPVNALHPIIIQGLKEKYAEAADRDDVKAIVLTGSVRMVLELSPSCRFVCADPSHLSGGLGSVFQSALLELFLRC